MFNRIILNMNIKKKIFLIILTFVIPFIIIISVALIILEVELYNSVEANMYHSKVSIVNEFKKLKNRTATYASMIAQNYLIQKSVYFNDTGTILKYVQPIFQEMQVDFITFHDLDNIIIAQADQPKKFNIFDKNNKAVLNAQQGEVSSIIKYDQEDVILGNVRPVYHISNPNLIIGTVSIGYKLSKSLIKELSHDIGYNILFSIDNKIFASSFQNKQSLKGIRCFPTDKLINIGDVKYDISYIPIKTLDDENFGIYIAVDNSSLKNTLLGIILWISIFFIIAIIITLLFSVKIRNNITNSIYTILKSTREIANQNYSVSIELDTNDEFKELADTFNMMAKNIDLNFSKIQSKNREIKNLQNYLFNIIESMPAMLIAVDKNDVITQWNNSATKLTGIKPIDAIGNKIWDILSFSSASNKYIKFFNQIKENKRSINIRREKIKNIPDKLFDLNMYPLVANGVSGIVLRIDDISEAEKRESQLIQAQKMEMVGTLAGGLAHDFNNVLGGIIGPVSLLKFKLNKDGKMEKDMLMEYLITIEDSGNRAADMVQQLLSLSKKHDLSFKSVDLNVSIKRVLKICKNTFDKSIEINIETDFEKAITNADETQIEQVLLNLCINASHAMTIMRNSNEHKGGTLYISLDKVFADRFFCSTHLEAKKQNYWIVTIKDNGVGIDSKILSQIFDPFFTTKGHDKGTGLGLSMAYNIIKLHNGFINVYSEVGIGTTFCIYIPVLYDTVENANIDTEELYKGSGLILVVDDENIIRNMAKFILKECGYDVIFAKNGKDAVELYKKRHLEIKGILLDMIMPVLSGEEAFVEIKKINKNVKILLASGFRKNEKIDALLGLGVDGFIQKPYTLQKLSKAIHKVMEE